MKYCSLLLFLAVSCAYAQFDGDYVLTAEKEGCPEGTLITSKDRIIFGGRLSFELKPEESKTQEEECFYHIKTKAEVQETMLKVTRWTERTKCNDIKFNGTSEEELFVDKGTATYSIASADPQGTKQEEIKC